LAALAMAGMLGGCGGDVGWDSGTLFRKPIDVAGRTSGYSYSDLGEASLTWPVNDADLVDANGSCAAAAAPPPAAATATGAAAETPHFSSRIFASSAASITVRLDNSSAIFCKSAIS
jgi:hypothetical protein